MTAKIELTEIRRLDDHKLLAIVNSVLEVAKAAMLKVALSIAADSLGCYGQ